MILLGLRLTLAGGREAVLRLAVTVAATALGVGLLLSALAVFNATTAQNARYAWLNTGVGPKASAATVDPLWWMLRSDTFKGRGIGRIDLAATGPRSPKPPGIPHLPGPGEYYATPALTTLLKSTPATELADRYPGHQIGTIKPPALPGPDTLGIIIGRRPSELSSNPHARLVSSIMTTPPSSCPGEVCQLGMNDRSMALTLSSVAAGVIFPTLILIGISSRLSAARRRQRFAAMRLVGATPRQVSLLSAVESTAGALVGVALGFAAYLLIRPSLTSVDLTGTPFFVSDLNLTLGQILLVVAGTPVAAAVAALIALRRVRISPLGVSRRVAPPPPRATRIIPLAAGVAELCWLAGHNPTSVAAQVAAFLTGAVLLLAGLVIAGPWFTLLAARILGRTHLPALLIAGRRLSDDPQAGFRAVSGLVLALCITTASVGAMTTITAERSLPSSTAAARTALVQTLGRPGKATQAEASAPTQALLAELRATRGVHGATVVHADPHDTGAGLASCAQLATMPVFGTCRSPGQAAEVPSDLGSRATWPKSWPTTPSPFTALSSLPPAQIIVATDGSATAIERSRTILATAYPGQTFAESIAEQHTGMSQRLAGYQRLADVIVLLSVPIAGCSLAVSVAGGLNDRRRPFSLLRLTGVPLSLLRRVVLLETAIPLAIVTAAAVGTGFLGAHLFLEAQFGYSLKAPGGGYYLTITSGLATALALIASVLPLLSTTTRPDTVRNE